MNQTELHCVYIKCILCFISFNNQIICKQIRIFEKKNLSYPHKTNSKTDNNNNNSHTHTQKTAITFPQRK